MYWLLDYEEQDRIREIILRLNKKLAHSHKRIQADQTFPFVGRKDRDIAVDIIEELSPENGTICDPFAGSGTFAYAALDSGRHIKANEWEPYAHEMMSAPFAPLLSVEDYDNALNVFKEHVRPQMEKIYETTCPECGRKLMFDGMFFDRDPEEYFNPTPHERMGKNGRENIIFRGKYKCECGCKEKKYDRGDEEVRLRLETMQIAFPDVELIENSRLNFTAPDFTHYGALFSKRQKIALVTLNDAIKELRGDTYRFFLIRFYPSYT